MFDVEVVLVTETRLFDKIRQAGFVSAAIARLCRPGSSPLDDLMTDLPGDYGVVLTYALFRGFVDLGPRMTETYLLFLNADFIISDGSLRHLGKLMLEGKRVIHAPSFRVVLEDVWPKLEAAVNRERRARDGPRDMVKLALAHKHVTVKARTINQRLYHQWWMDQFYWYVDEDTLIGYQWPVALVAIKPERVVTEPVLVWDYGFIPEAAPTAPGISSQTPTTSSCSSRRSATPARTWCGSAGSRPTTSRATCPNGPPGSSASAASSCSSFTQARCRRASAPSSTNRGNICRRSTAGSIRRRSRTSGTAGSAPGSTVPGTACEAGRLTEATRAFRPLRPASGTLAAQIRRLAISALQKGYAILFGRLPEISRHHPLWIDTYAITAKLAQWEASGKSRVLWLCSGDSLFHRKLKDRHDPMSLLMETEPASPLMDRYYDVCLCELRPEDLSSLRRLYERIRPTIREGGEIVVYVFNKSDAQLRADDIAFCDGALPDRDRSTLNFFGSPMTARLRRSYLQASTSFQGRPLTRGVLTAGVLLALAPLVRIANAVANRSDASIFEGAWTSLMMVFTVGRRLDCSVLSEPTGPHLEPKSADAWSFRRCQFSTVDIWVNEKWKMSCRLVLGQTTHAARAGLAEIASAALADNS